MSAAQSADHGLRFQDLVFDQHLLSAVRDDGAELRLTRQERALLGQFIAHPHRLLSRDQLLSALSNDASDISDRNVDFIVNRLRRKLNDSARKPRFIATQYGEGYIWIADPSAAAPEPPLLVLGPMLGAPDVIALEAAQRFVQRLQRALEERTAPGRVATSLHGRGDLNGRGSRFSLEISLRRQDAALEVVLTLRQEPGHSVVGVHPLETVEAVSDLEVGALATTVMAEIWRRLAVRHGDLVAPTEAPLAVRIHDAAQLLNASDEDWSRIAPKLAADRAADPDDPHTAIIWAIYLQSRLMRAQAGDPADPGTYAPLEDEIEGLVFANLPQVRSEPAFALAAASLLIGVHRRHEDFAESLVRSVLSQSPAYVMALPVLGEIELKRGALDEAMTHYDEALRLCEPGTETEIFLLVLKLRALTANDDRDAADAVFDRIKQIKPLAGRQLGLVYVKPGGDNLTPDLRRRLDRLTVEDARRALGFQYYVVARRFGVPAHRLNIMAGPMDHLIRRFGRDAVPPAVATSLASDQERSGSL